MDITPDNAWPSSFPVIDDGDVCNNAEHLATAKALADAVTFLRARLMGASALVIRRHFSVYPFYNPGGWDEIVSSPTTGIPRIRSDASTNAAMVPWSSVLPHTGTLKKIVLYLDGGSTHVGLPAVMPKFELASLDWGASVGAASFNSTATIELTQSDVSATVAAYELVHTIEWNGSIVLNGSAKQYWLRVFGENGANSLADELSIPGGYFEVSV